MTFLAINLMDIDSLPSASGEPAGFAAMRDLAIMADEMGVDKIVLPEHVLISRQAHANREGFPYPVEASWFDPMVALGAIAAVTRNARLSTNVMIAPLRPAPLLAKQLATLDALSGGRLDAAFGVGWQREEYDAAERAFEGRFGTMDEQIAACRALWAGGDAQFVGKKVSFDDAWSMPQPVQGAALPIYLGLALTPRGVQRVVTLADGWQAPPMPAAEFADAVATITDAAGTKPMHFTGALSIHPRGTVMSAVDDPFAQAAGLWQAGAHTVIAHPRHFCESMADVERYLTDLVAQREATAVTDS
ncbi:TIGR03619 family F420-dependent LLM class oxidoreductase [Microbacterium sp. NC79]|uniref:TIGR03619 family F420-dependent LLM class oxidoreductase n=1 Tax=Microbacterium sp. NC79 TaxID=2851009 RepID=UPI001C2C9B89|nr:TIGR03619 family F420-dependent LLM class oxidoreductase [Microbacterium sp. NC79]MBV0895710.1 TIGR03619 family F420-dependent LLM class oxidoreductase [Microbacterium sp. NC79]